MVFLSPLPANAILPYNLDAAPRLEYTTRAAPSLPSPVGQPKFGARLGFAEADTTSYFGGIDLTIPVSAGVRLFAIRGDADYWLNTSSNGGRGGDSLSVLGIFGPGTAYFGAGPSYSSRISGASGPQGAGVKVVFGSQVVSMVGYETNLILSQKGLLAAVMATFHF